MRLIDADKIRTNIVWMKTANDMFKAEIDRQPTVEAEPVGHAYWVYDGTYYRRCSNCGHQTGEDNIWWEHYQTKFTPPKYCEECGYKMDGGKSR